MIDNANTADPQSGALSRSLTQLSRCYWIHYHEAALAAISFRRFDVRIQMFDLEISQPKALL